MSLSADEIKLSQISTKNDYVNLILDLVSYTPDCMSSDLSVLDAGCGKGNFITSAIDRYLTNAIQLKLDVNVISDKISKLFVGYEIDDDLCNITKLKIQFLLMDKGNLPEDLANYCVDKVIINGDFLKWNTDKRFDIILENPPYIRYDNLSKKYVEWLRANFTCFIGRSDLCVPFIQKSLGLLSARARA